MSTIVGWGHPVVGVLAVWLVVAAAGRAARIRQGGVGAAAARRAHRRLAPRALVAAAVAWVTGLIAVWLFHDELHAAASGHFRVGTLLLGLLVANAFLARRIDDARVRAIHPWIGAAAVLATGVQVFLGLQLLRR